jgi:hypothetical protein
MGRRVLAAALAAALSLTVAGSAAAQARRALVIGIDTYRYPDAQLAPWRAAADRSVAAWRARAGFATGGSTRADSAAAETRARIPNLDGSANDAQGMAAMLRSGKYGFTDVRLLRNADATRDGILAAIEQLIADAQRGDVVVFYYAGHGSQRVNSLADVKLNRLDQTIVPADANAGQFDIRNTELAALFDRLLDKGVQLTLIFDSCHSGSITRGETAPAKRRWAAADPRDARDSVRPPPPESLPHGALFLAAAEDFQSAQETVDRTDQQPHGAFTSALLRVMRQVPASEPATQVFARVRALLQQDDRPQNPVLRGIGDDPRRPLFGRVQGTLAGAMTVAVQRVDGDTVLLQGGLELGFGTGTELTLADTAKRKGARIRVVAAGLGGSKAVAVAPSARADAVHSGDLMVVQRWVGPDRPSLRLWIPAAVSPPTLAAAAKQFAALRTSTRVEWVDDPSALPDDGRPLYVIRYEATGWRLQSPAGEPLALAAATASAVEAAVNGAEVAAVKRAADEARALRQATIEPRGRPRAFVLLPPTTAVRAQLHLGRGSRNDAITVQPTPDGADYLLVGRDSAGEVAYAWLRPNMRSAAGDRSSLPVRSDWVGTASSATAAGAQLEASAVALARVNGWLTIEPPDPGTQFPYRLSLRNIRTGELKDSGTTRGGDRYDLVLRRDPAIDADEIAPRWVYIFSIDSWGKGTLIWSYTNTIPFDSAGTRRAPVEIHLIPNGELLGGPYIPIGSPYGTDTFILVSSAEQLDPSVFTLEAARTRLDRPSKSALDQLFLGVGRPTRGETPAVPVTWSIQRVPLRSVRRDAP